MSETAKTIASGVDNRRFHRTTVLWPASLVHDGRALDCVIFNISANGAKVITKVQFPEKAAVILRSVRFGELSGEIVWSSPSAIGIRFMATPQDVAKAMGDSLPLLPAKDGHIA
jgi:hypothetical protein